MDLDQKRTGRPDRMNVVRASQLLLSTGSASSKTQQGAGRRERGTLRIDPKPAQAGAENNKQKKAACIPRSRDGKYRSHSSPL